MIISHYVVSIHTNLAPWDAGKINIFPKKHPFKSFSFTFLKFYIVDDPLVNVSYKCHKYWIWSVYSDVRSSVSGICYGIIYKNNHREEVCGSIRSCLLYYSDIKPIFLFKYWWHWKRKRRARFRCSAHFRTSGKSNHFRGTNRLIFFPLDLPACRCTSVAPCAERKGHNWPWPQTAWGAKTAQPHIITPGHQSKKDSDRNKGEKKSQVKVQRKKAKRLNERETERSVIGEKGQILRGMQSVQKITER